MYISWNLILLLFRSPDPKFAPSSPLNYKSSWCGLRCNRPSGVRYVSCEMADVPYNFVIIVIYSSVIRRSLVPISKVVVVVVVVCCCCCCWMLLLLKEYCCWAPRTYVTLSRASPVKILTKFSSSPKENAGPPNRDFCCCNVFASKSCSHQWF